MLGSDIFVPGYSICIEIKEDIWCYLPNTSMQKGEGLRQGTWSLNLKWSLPTAHFGFLMLKRGTNVPARVIDLITVLPQCRRRMSGG